MVYYYFIPSKKQILNCDIKECDFVKIFENESIIHDTQINFNYLYTNNDKDIIKDGINRFKCYLNGKYITAFNPIDIGDQNDVEDIQNTIYKRLSQSLHDYSEGDIIYIVISGGPSFYLPLFMTANALSYNYNVKVLGIDTSKSIGNMPKFNINDNDKLYDRKDFDTFSFNNNLKFGTLKEDVDVKLDKIDARINKSFIRYNDEYKYKNALNTFDYFSAKSLVKNNESIELINKLIRIYYADDDSIVTYYLKANKAYLCQDYIGAILEINNFIKKLISDKVHSEIKYKELLYTAQDFDTSNIDITFPLKWINVDNFNKIDDKSNPGNKIILKNQKDICKNFIKTVVKKGKYINYECIDDPNYQVFSEDEINQIQKEIYTQNISKFKSIFNSDINIDLIIFDETKLTNWLDNLNSSKIDFNGIPQELFDEKFNKSTCLIEGLVYFRNIIQHGNLKKINLFKDYFKQNIELFFRLNNIISYDNEYEMISKKINEHLINNSILNNKELNKKENVVLSIVGSSDPYYNGLATPPYYIFKRLEKENICCNKMIYILTKGFKKELENDDIRHTFILKCDEVFKNNISIRYLYIGDFLLHDSLDDISQWQDKIQENEYDYNKMYHEFKKFFNNYDNYIYNFNDSSALPLLRTSIILSLILNHDFNVYEIKDMNKVLDEFKEVNIQINNKHISNNHNLSNFPTSFDFEPKSTSKIALANSYDLIRKCIKEKEYDNLNFLIDLVKEDKYIKDFNDSLDGMNSDLNYNQLIIYKKLKSNLLSLDSKEENLTFEIVNAKKIKALNDFYSLVSNLSLICYIEHIKSLTTLNDNYYSQLVDLSDLTNESIYKKRDKWFSNYKDQTEKDNEINQADSNALTNFWHIRKSKELETVNILTEPFELYFISFIFKKINPHINNIKSNLKNIIEIRNEFIHAPEKNINPSDILSRISLKDLLDAYKKLKELFSYLKFGKKIEDYFNSVDKNIEKLKYEYAVL